jgi:hypothetical protein
MPTRADSFEWAGCSLSSGYGVEDCHARPRAFRIVIVGLRPTKMGDPGASAEGADP